MKLARLKNIACSITGVGSWHSPLEHMNHPFKVEVDLITGKITPELDEGDDVKKHLEMWADWFHKAISKEEIPLDSIEEAKVKINEQGYKECIIKAGGRTFTNL